MPILKWQHVIWIGTLLVFLLGSTADGSEAGNPGVKLKGPYLGMKPPGKVPELFAPGIVSTLFHEHSFLSFSPDGSEIYWTTIIKDNYKYRFPRGILRVRKMGDRWQTVDYIEIGIDGDGSNGVISPDGKQLFFNLFRRMADGKWNSDLYVMTRQENRWFDPRPVPGEINTERMESQVSVSRNNTLYFIGHLEGVRNNYGIYRSVFKNGRYQKPELLPAQVNSKAIDWTPWISPDEKILLWSSYREGGHGSGDLYAVYRDRSDSSQWSKAINLGPTINRADNERFPSLSPDGKYLFFLSDKLHPHLEKHKQLSHSEVMKYYFKPGNGMCDFYWVDSAILRRLRPTPKSR